MNNLNNILKSKNVSMLELKKSTGISNIKPISEGKDLKLSQAQKIAAVLEVSIDEVWPNNYKLETVTETVEKTVLVGPA